MQYNFKINDDTFMLDTERLLMSECIAIEKVTGQTWQEWQQAVSNGSMTALKAGLWIAVKRQQPELRFSEFDFAWSDFEVVEEATDDSGDSDPKEVPSES